VPESTVWRIVHDVSAGLAHIHGCGIVHLDVKPANLLISQAGVVKIGDFGMAADQGQGEDGHEVSRGTTGRGVVGCGVVWCGVVWCAVRCAPVPYTR